MNLLRNRRIKILNHWLMGRRNNVSLFELVNVLTDKTCVQKAKSIISEIKHIEDYHIIFLNDHSIPLYFPANLPLRPIEMVIAEIFYPKDWHYYEIPEYSNSKRYCGGLWSS